MVRVSAPEPNLRDTTALARDPVASGPWLRRSPWPLRRAAWHTAGLVAAIALAWLILRAYRRPDFLIDLVNLNLC
jgi:hypothetical protein